MSELTITEALAEIKTLAARLEKKRGNLGKFVIRNIKMVDPIKDAGGSLTYVSQERQSILDLENRMVNIRTSIQIANQQNILVIGTKSASVATWLNWRREISNLQRQFLHSLSIGITNARASATLKGSTETADNNIIVNLDEKKLMAEIEEIETLCGDLDGKLSLFNATKTITV